MKFIKNYLNWNTYFTVALLFECLLVLKIYPMSGKLHIILFVLYFFITGLKQNIDKSLEFLKKYCWIFVFLILWIVHFGVKSDNTKLVLIFFLYFYSGYLSSYQNKRYMDSGKVFVLCFFPILIVSLILHFLQINPLLSRFPAAMVFKEYSTDRLVSIFAHAIPAGCIFTVYALLSLFSVKNKILKYGCFLLGLLCGFLSGSRGCMLGCLITLMILLWIYKDILKILCKEFCSKKSVALILAFFIVFFILLYNVPSINNQITGVWSRILGAKNEMGNSFYRFVAWKVMLTIAWPSSSLSTKLLGGGYQSCLPAMVAAGNEFINSVKEGNSAGLLLGTVDNAYFSLLYDGGLLAIIVILAILGFTIYELIKGDKNGKHLAVVILSLNICALTFDMQYWSSITFVFLYMFGLLVGGYGHENEN